MAYTPHGHHIPGTIKGGEFPPQVARCGGLQLCKTCMMYANTYMAKLKEPLDFNATNAKNDGKDHLGEAKSDLAAFLAVRWHKTDRVPPTIEDIYVVSFTKVLQNWKALLCTNHPDGMYYELTYNGEKKELYIDSYKKIENFVMTDQGVGFVHPIRG